jgi:hypothetical protein
LEARTIESKATFEDMPVRCAALPRDGSSLTLLELTDEIHAYRVEHGQRRSTGF